jgi:hypothetical protein
MDVTVPVNVQQGTDGPSPVNSSRVGAAWKDNIPEGFDVGTG